MTTFRTKRIENTMKTAIAEIIQREIKDPRLGFITISDIKISKDLRNAVIYISVLKQEGKPQDSIDILQNSRSLIKKFLREKMILKYIPDITFKIDTSLDNAFHIEELIKKLHSEENKNNDQE